MTNCGCVDPDEVRDSRLQKEMKAGAEKIPFFEKHKRHSKTLREIQRLKQDENAVKISRRTHFCYHVNLFFFLEKISSMLLSLAREKSTYILKNEHVYFSLQMM